MKIKITKNGPYLVSKDIPLNQLIITKGKDEYVYKESKIYINNKDYKLCRCGRSKNKPFCDGSHFIHKFDGECTASKEPICKRAKTYTGDKYTMEDTENLCAFARFCHIKNTDSWNLVETANTTEEEELLKKSVIECPSGRLVLYDKKTKEVIEPEYKKEISLLEDPANDCMGPLWVKGNIPIEDQDGNTLEIRNRVTLCRCGASKNKPYCDSSHLYFYED